MLGALADVLAYRKLPVGILADSRSFARFTASKRLVTVGDFVDTVSAGRLNGLKSLQGDREKIIATLDMLGLELHE